MRECSGWWNTFPVVRSASPAWSRPRRMARLCTAPQRGSVPKTGEPVAPERCVAPMQTLMAGIPRNFEVFDPLDFLAEVTQHIPNKGEHQIRYYGLCGAPHKP